MGNDFHLLVEQVAHDLQAITSTLSTITSLSSSINTLALYGQYIINDAEELKRKSAQLEEIEREARFVLHRVELRARQLDERESKLDKQEEDLKYREVRLSHAMKRVEAREEKIAEKERKWQDIESQPDENKQELMVIMKGETEQLIQQCVDETPNITKLNVGGEIFTVEKQIIMKHPGSLLAFMLKQGRFKGNQEVFIDRDPKLFPQIINIMRGSARVVPNNSMYCNEFQFWFHNAPLYTPIIARFVGVILGWLPKMFSLLYDSSSHGMSISKFHSLCDDKGPTLSIIQSQGYLFGGYNPDHWQSPEKPIKKHLPSSFLFTLSNPHGIPPTQYWPQKDQHSIRQHKDYGIYFGGSSNEDGGLYVKVGVIIDFPGQNFIDTTGKGRKTFTGRGGANTIDAIFVYSVK